MNIVLIRYEYSMNIVRKMRMVRTDPVEMQYCTNTNMNRNLSIYPYNINLYILNLSWCPGIATSDQPVIAPHRSPGLTSWGLLIRQVRNLGSTVAKPRGHPAGQTYRTISKYL